MAAGRDQGGGATALPAGAGSIGAPRVDHERRLLLDVLALAFLDNPMNVAIHGGSPRQRLRANRAGLGALVLDSGELAVQRVIRVGDRVVGGWVALRPGLFALPRPRFSRQIGCFFLQGVRAMERWGRVSQELEDLRPGGAHWYLAALGVDPQLQGRGLGGALLRELERIVAKDPAPIYLECDREESVRFYQRWGYQERAVRRVHGVRCVCLGRGFADLG